jgi:Domain of unknown function (DUF4917)
MSADVQHPLGAADQVIFQALGTENFEATMAGLKLSRQVCAALGIQAPQIDQRYTAIQTALIEAVHAVHIGWGNLPGASLEKIRDALLPYDYVYSTNYDLLIYWAIMHDPKVTGFTDYFWGSNCEFDLGNTEVWTKVTKVLYLHGAIHLYRLSNGVTVKKAAVNTGNLLETFGQPFHGVDVPLFVAEGQADDKQRSIRRSEYLSFAFSKFSEHRGPLVVFGHGLGNADLHLVNAMKHWSRLTVPQIAISMRPDTAQNIRRDQGGPAPGVTQDEAAVLRLDNSSARRPSAEGECLGLTGRRRCVVRSRSQNGDRRSKSLPRSPLSRWR